MKPYRSSVKAFRYSVTETYYLNEDERSAILEHARALGMDVVPVSPGQLVDRYLRQYGRHGITLARVYHESLPSRPGKPDSVSGGQTG